MTDDRKFPPFLVKLPGAGGARYFWQPSTRLRADGWRPQRVPDRWASFTDPDALEFAAILKAEEINRDLAKPRAEAKADPVGAGGPPRTVDDLIARYRATDEFKGLRASSLRIYNRSLRQISEGLGEARLRDVDNDRVKRFFGTHTRTTTPKILRMLFALAARKDWVKSNPAAMPGLKREPPSGLPWPHDAVLAFVEMADRMGHYSAGTAIMLNEWAGQRPDDVLHFGWTAYRGGDLMVQQSKTGASVILPLADVPHLGQRLEAERARQKARKVVSATIIASELTGKPYTRYESFRRLFATIRSAVALEKPSFNVDYIVPGRMISDPDAFTVRTEDLKFRHLRHTAVTRLAEAGCTVPDIGAITGHSLQSINEIITHYLSRTKAQARRAFAKRLAVEKPDAAAPPQAIPDPKAETV